MANMLEKYQDITDEAATLFGEAADKAERQSALSKKDRKVLKRLEKNLRRHNKLLKKVIEQKNTEREAAETSADACRKNDRGKKFLSNLGKEFCKVLPKLVAVVVTGILGFIFKPKSSGKTPQTA